MKFNPKSLLMFLIVAFLGVLIVRSASAGGGSLSVSPANALVGFSTFVDLDLSGLANIQGADVALSFDETILQVVDADGVTGGVQIVEGDCPSPDFVVLNDADNGAGTIEYAAVSTSGTCGSGTLASIEFLCTAEGSSPVTITSSELSDNNGFLITHTEFNGQVTCFTPNTFIYLPLIKKD